MVGETSPREQKKGDLTVTIIAARNLSKGDGVYCVLDLPENKPVRTSVNKDKKDPVWSEAFVLDLFSFDTSELLVSVFARKRLTTDKFLGQIQIPIKALAIPKDEQWYYLTDKPSVQPETPKAPKTPKGMSKRSHTISMKKSVSKSDDEGVPVFIQGELCVRLHFIHRLMRGKSRALMVSDGAETPRSAGTSTPSALSPPLSARTVSFMDDKKPDLSILAPGYVAGGDPGLSKNEANIIDNALREKKNLVMKKLEEKRELIRVWKEKVSTMQPDTPQYQSDHKKLQEMEDELKELEKLEKEVIELLDSQKQKEDDQTREVRKGSFMKTQPATNGKQENLVKGSHIKVDPRRMTQRFPSVPRLDLPGADIDKSGDGDDPKVLKMKIKMLEAELESEKKLCEMANSKIILLEKENCRLEAELHEQKDHNHIRSRSNSLSSSAIIFGHQPLQLDAILAIHNEVAASTKESREALDARRKEVEEKLKAVEVDIEQNTVLQKRLEVEIMERRLSQRSGLLTKLQKKTKRAQLKLDDEQADMRGSGEDSESELSDYDSADLSDRSGGNNRARSKSPKPGMAPEPSTDKFDMLVGKLEKLDKLDELLRKIDAMKYITASEQGGSGVTSSGRSYAELKQELDDLQKIIFDEANTYSEKEREDANIKYEKTFGELAQTAEFKAEQQQALEEKRRLNEPLNKEALEKMLKIYNPANILNDAALKDKIIKNPELSLIGMEPKAILAKHQNDFSQYLLRLTDIDELRAIRASLPKFRNDQKRQLEWVEVLENKIEQVAKAPPKKPPPKPVAPKWKAKPAPKAGGAPPTDMFAELLAKRGRRDVDGGVEEAPPKSPKPGLEKKENTISKIKLAPIKTSGGMSPTPPSPMSPQLGIPPPPPPPLLKF